MGSMCAESRAAGAGAAFVGSGAGGAWERGGVHARRRRRAQCGVVAPLRAVAGREHDGGETRGEEGEDSQEQKQLTHHQRVRRWQQNAKQDWKGARADTPVVDESLRERIARSKQREELLKSVHALRRMIEASGPMLEGRAQKQNVDARLGRADGVPMHVNSVWIIRGSWTDPQDYFSMKVHDHILVLAFESKQDARRMFDHLVAQELLPSTADLAEVDLDRVCSYCTTKMLTLGFVQDGGLRVTGSKERAETPDSDHDRARRGGENDPNDSDRSGPGSVRQQQQQQQQQQKPVGQTETAMRLERLLSQETDVEQLPNEDE
ncbi:hypothetical protein FVE85_4986 [Porphyridium purpureum]|uniref:Uncharacterized protein n=1 Tax=Porphyridium purpureum TaxID=35688 RepID=A0A5J4YQV9_PORPP|nr:hypothetical protein FVE85_4986 [Porphyridium purpureum]|eukprot:POR9730..scf236_6